ncbi:formate dehydrogenase accessory sulfurtransferase FdhD [Pseudactinotalea sp.]|uniref:formate dehydrogenase accessory sulfurtransferase FdhD n=1 Tax=Pseudactinotalea sp. TaxID=1926260 RepID=UPI003B3ABBDE
MARSTRRAPVLRLRADGSSTQRPDTLAGEEPLEIRVDGEQWLVTMRTPGGDVDLVHGLLLSEGIITRTEQVRQVSYGPGVGAGGLLEYNVMDVTLDAGEGAQAPARRERAVYVSGSCGICGTSSIEAVARASHFPVADVAATVPLATLLTLPEALRRQQRLFDGTGGTHAAGLFSGEQTLAVREDVGRHNAVDKVLGWALRGGRLPLHDAVLQVSGRLSYELVQKAAMAGVPVVAAVSAPSAAAVDLAENAGITLIGFSRATTLSVYSRADRVI